MLFHSSNILNNNAFCSSYSLFCTSLPCPVMPVSVPVRPVDVWGLRDVAVKVKERLRLVCRCSGNPLPAILWLKDGVRINATRNTRIQYKK